MPVLPDGIPAELRELARWVGWRYELRSGDWTKVPIDVQQGHRGRPAKSTDPQTWAPFSRAARKYTEGVEHRDHCVAEGKPPPWWKLIDGIGIVLGDGLAGVDLDDCRDPDTGVIAPWAADIIRRLDSYAEVSPSGTGVKIVVRGTKPAGRCRTGNIEMYAEARYFTLTGRLVPGSPAAVHERTAELAALHAELFPAGAAGSEARPGVDPPPPLDESDDELLQVAFGAKNGAKVRALYHGELNGYASASEADLALCSHLAFYLREPDRIDRVFRGSSLYRSKWDRADYRERTIARALEGRTEFYKGKKGRRRKGSKAKFTGAAGDGVANGPPPGESGASSAGQQWPPPAVTAIADWLRATYAPKFRRGGSRKLYSAMQGREITPSEISPTSSILATLGALDDAPTARGGGGRVVDVQALPYHFRTWLPVAWGDLSFVLPDEQHVDEVVDLAREEFVGRLKGALLAITSIQYTYRKTGDSEERNEVQKRPIIEWARMFAKPKHWGNVRGYCIYGRKDNGVLRVALRAELFSQLHVTDLKGLAQRRFTDLCILYGVGTPTSIKGGMARATELTPEFLADVLFDPNDPQTQEGQTHAPACEATSVRLGEEVNIDAIKH